MFFFCKKNRIGNDFKNYIIFYMYTYIYKISKYYDSFKSMF